MPGQSETLYIGNATKQTLAFQYRIARDHPVREQLIPSGAQVRISGDLTPAQVDHIVRQHVDYGMVAASSIDQSKGFHGTCYSIGAHITQTRLMMLMTQNHGALVERGREIREQTAVAQNDLLEKTLIEQDRPERITQMEVTVQQENEDPKNDVPQFSEGFRVIRGSERPAPSTSKRRKAA